MSETEEEEMKPKKPPALYKLTSDGRSPHTHYEWTIPTRGEPGQWHAIEGAVKPHSNGFHLTSDPKQRWRNGFEVWRVETDGEVLRVNEDDVNCDEWCAAKVRLVVRLSPAELDALNVGVDRSWRSSYRASRFTRKRIPEGESPAVRLIRIVHDHAGTSGNKSGENLANTCMQKALDLAIEARMEFGPDDVKTIAAMYDGIATEWRYAGFVQSGNLSACKSWEKFDGLTPWIWQGERLYSGARLPWAGRDCKVTTFGHDKLVVCSYHVSKWRKDAESRDSKVEKRFTVTREALAAADRAWTAGAALRAEIEATDKALDRTGAPVSGYLIALWTAEERTAARTWAVFKEADSGKTRIAPPEIPACVARDSAITVADRKAWTATERAYWSKPDRDRGPYPKREHAPEIAAAHAAVVAWHEAMFVGVPADYVKRSAKKAA